MINPFQYQDATLDEAIASAFSNLETYQPDSDEYARTVTQLSKLYAIKNTTLQSYQDAQQFELNFSIEQEKLGIAENDAAKPFYMRVDPNVALTVAGNLVVALIVVKYEQTGVIMSKFTQFMKKI